jgi:hypothetical protein
MVMVVYCGHHVTLYLNLSDSIPAFITPTFRCLHNEMACYLGPTDVGEVRFAPRTRVVVIKC